MAYRTIVLSKSGTELVREYQPANRVISFEGEEFLVKFPYTLFAAGSNGLQIGFAKSPVKSLRTKIYCATVGNVYGDWHVCGCHGRKMDSLVEQFWQTEFTTDGQAGCDALEAAFGGRQGRWSPEEQYSYWEKLSKKGLRAVTKEITDYSISFNRFLLRMMGFDQHLEEDYDDYYDDYDDYNDNDKRARKFATEAVKTLKLTLEAPYPKNKVMTLAQFTKAMMNKKAKKTKKAKTRK